MDEWTTTTTTTTTTTHICVYTSHRRPGYGRVLLQHAMQTCIKRGATMAFVSVQTSKGLSHHHGQWSRETFRTTHPNTIAAPVHGHVPDTVPTRRKCNWNIGWREVHKRPHAWRSLRSLLATKRNICGATTGSTTVGKRLEHMQGDVAA